MNIYFVDYSTHSSNKKLAVAVNRERPDLIAGSFLDFVSGKGINHPSFSSGHIASLPSQTDMFSGNGEKGINVPIAMGINLPSPSPGDIIVVESNFEPHDPDEQNKIIDYCEQVNILIRCLPPRITGRVKKRLDKLAKPKGHKPELIRGLAEWAEKEGLEIHDHDDLRAVEAIRWCYFDNTTTSAPKRANWGEKTNLGILKILRTGGGLTMSNPWTKRIVNRYLPTSMAMCDPDIGKCYIQDREYLLSLVLLTLFATCETDNGRRFNTREEFERRIGLYGAGYPSLERSSFIARAMTLARQALNKSQHWQYNSALASEAEKEMVGEMRRLVRRATRKMRREIIRHWKAEGLHKIE